MSVKSDLGAALRKFANHPRRVRIDAGDPDDVPPTMLMLDRDGDFYLSVDGLILVDFDGTPVSEMVPVTDYPMEGKLATCGALVWLATHRALFWLSEEDVAPLLMWHMHMRNRMPPEDDDDGRETLWESWRGKCCRLLDSLWEVGTCPD